MQTLISLKQFALTGDFGPVRVGMKRDIAVQLLGEPDTDHDYGGGSCALYYAWYELFYEGKTGEITGIQNDHLLVRDRKHKLDIYFETERAKIDKWFLRYTKNISEEQVRAILDEEPIPYSMVPHFDSEILKFPSGVYLDFEIDEKTDTKVLNGIRHFPSR